LRSGVAAATTPAPDTGHLSVAAAGADLLTAAERERPPAPQPDIGDLTLAPAGSPLETLRAPAPARAPDTSALSLAPAGSPVLDEEQRRKPAPPAPATDHLRVLDH
jgi:hypothetical protein